MEVAWLRVLDKKFGPSTGQTREHFGEPPRAEHRIGAEMADFTMELKERASVLLSHLS